MLRIYEGDLFKCGLDALVNPVNCVGVMGAGLAKVFKLRYPDMFDSYAEACEDRRVDIGHLTIWRTGEDDGTKGVINFPTKRHWKEPSEMEYLEKGLRAFAASCDRMGFDSYGFPLLGAGLGGLPEDDVMSVMVKHLYPLKKDIDICL